MGLDQTQVLWEAAQALVQTSGSDQVSSPVPAPSGSTLCGVEL